MRSKRNSSLSGVSAATSERMARVGQRNNSAERALRSELHVRGVRFRLHRPVEGTRRTIDIAFVSKRLAVFIDGCFWHGCPTHGSTPKNNAEWWRRKIDANVTRDRDTTARLENDGWRVVRVWEHELPAVAADRILRLLRPVNGRNRSPWSQTGSLEKTQVVHALRSRRSRGNS